MESYFADYQGDCVDGTFVLSGNGFDVQFSQVISDRLNVTVSRAVIAIDNSGKLTVTTNDGGYLNV